MNDPGKKELRPDATTADFIVCEQNGKWAVALTTALDDVSIRVRQTRSWNQSLALLRAAPASVIVIEMTADNVDDVLQWLITVHRRFPAGLALVVARRCMRRHQWLARELGAMAFFTSPRSLGPLTQVVGRYLRAAPRPQQTYTEQIMTNLPWAEA